jgi:hypothetical protein
VTGVTAKSNKVTDTGGSSAQQSSLASAKSSRPLSPQARELLQDQAGGLPVWIRAPKTGVEYHSGFSRSKLYELAGKGVIRSVSIRAPGQVKGTRLFHLQSILDFIARCEAEGGAA